MYIFTVKSQISNLITVVINPFLYLVVQAWRWLFFYSRNM